MPIIRIKQYEIITNSHKETERLKEIIGLSRKNFTIVKDKLTYSIRIKLEKSFLQFSIKTNSENVITKISYSNGKSNRSVNKILHVLNNIIEDINLVTNEGLKDKLELIRCYNNLCPICSSPLEKISSFERHCKNDCYSIWYSTKYHEIEVSVTVFEKKLKAFGSNSMKTKINTINAICNQIFYWKQNDNYLAKLILQN